MVGIDRIQPVIVGMQLALTALWRSYGVEPDAVIGSFDGRGGQWPSWPVRSAGEN